MSHEPNQIDRIVGANLGSRRAASGLTQEAFGAACERPITAQQVSKYERGENQITSMRLVEFAKVLKCPVAALFDGVAELLPPSKASRRDSGMMHEYQALPDALQESVRVLVQAMLKEVSNKLTAGAKQ